MAPLTIQVKSRANRVAVTLERGATKQAFESEAMGLRAPSLADMDAFEVSRKRKPVKLSNARSVNVILWRVDGSAVVAHSRRTTDCCTNTIWRRMMCARHVGRNKQQYNSRETEDADDENLDHDFLELGETHQSPLMKEVGSKLQSSFNMRRWPQGWI